MTVRTQRIYATFDEVAGETKVTVRAGDWTPDYEGLTEAVMQKLHLDRIAEETDPKRTSEMYLGEASFDDEADSLGSDNVELDLEQARVDEYGR